MSEAMEVYLHLKSLATGMPQRARPRRTARPRRSSEDERGATSPFGTGRDPRGLGDVVDALAADLGWGGALARGEVLALWPAIVGEETARHAEPVGADEETLIVRCDSTAWSTQLRIMRADILTRIAREHPASGIRGIRFLAPDAPSWKRGPRSVPGRGPRDTYG